MSCPMDLPKTVDESFQECLSIQLLTHATASWMHWYGLLVLYKEEDGHCVIPRSLDRDAEFACLSKKVYKNNLKAGLGEA